MNDFKPFGKRDGFWDVSICFFGSLDKFDGGGVLISRPFDGNELEILAEFIGEALVGVACFFEPRLGVGDVFFCEVFICEAFGDDTG